WRLYLESAAKVRSPVLAPNSRRDRLLCRRPRRPRVGAQLKPPLCEFGHVPSCFAKTPHVACPAIQNRRRTEPHLLGDERPHFSVPEHQSIGSTLLSSANVWLPFARLLQLADSPYSDKDFQKVLREFARHRVAESRPEKPSWSSEYPECNNRIEVHDTLAFIAAADASHEGLATNL